LRFPSDVEGLVSSLSHAGHPLYKGRRHRISVDILKNMPQKTITLTRRTTIAIIAIAACAVLVGSSIAANFIVPNNSYRVPASPGITAYEADGVTQIASIAWGDIQIGSIAQTHQVVLRNT